MEQWTQIYRAGYVVIRAFPAPLRRFLAPGGIADLNARRLGTRIDFLRALERTVEAHPQEVAVIAAAPAGEGGREEA